MFFPLPPRPFPHCFREFSLTLVLSFFFKPEQFCRDRKTISKPTQLYLASITTEADTQILMVPVKQKLNFTKKN